MPFAVFRQHQRKLLAVFAILAMIGFVLSDTLPRWINNSGGRDGNPVVAELYGKKIHASDLAIMSQKRQFANRFMAYADRFGNPYFFGGTTRAEMIDALILEHEADRLGIPQTSAFAHDWIDQQTNKGIDASTFELILSKFDNKIGGEQLLVDVASQIRLLLARQDVFMPIVTPLDVFRNYRDQTERTSFKVVPYVVESFTGKLAEPNEDEVAELYNKYKDVLPDQASPTPGFKVPRKVSIESLSVDINDIVKRIKDKLPEDELKSYYEGRKSDFPMDRELPVDLFAGAPQLTPPRFIPFSELRDSLADALARERANEELQDTFGKIRDEIIDKFADKYIDIEGKIAEAKKDGSSTEGLALPKSDDLAGVAAKYGMKHEITGLIDRRQAEVFSRISLAKAGMSPQADSKKFADIAFDPKTSLYEGFELNDVLGDRYLARKIADVPAHVEELKVKDIHDQVVRAWKLDKARPLAKKAADDYADKLKAEGAQIKDLSVDGHPVIAIDSVTKLQPGMPIATQFSFRRGRPVPSEIRQIPEAGPTLIDTLFDLKPGQVAVEPDLPQSTYYVLALEKRDPVAYMSLLGPNGSLASYWQETQIGVGQKALKEAMARLREQAGYHPENYPSEDKNVDDNFEG